MRTTHYIYISVTDMDTGETITGDDVMIDGNGAVLRNESMTAQDRYRVRIKIIKPPEESEFARLFVYSFLNDKSQRETVE